MKKIFLTGAPGWLGTRLVKLVTERSLSCQLSDLELRCLVLPNMNGDELKKYGAEVVAGNVCDPDSLKGKLEGCDAVVHACGIIHPKRVRDFYRINLEGTKNVWDEALRAGAKRFIFISSNSPAGFSAPGKPFKETDSPRPYMHYGKSKRLAEEFLLEHSGSGGMQSVILRPCWYYGPDQPERQTKFFKMIKKGNPLFFGSGQNLRSMSYIDNVIQAIILSLQVERAGGQIYWIADERPYSMLEVYQAIANLLGVKTLKPRKIPALSSWVFEQADRMIQALGLYQKEIHVAGEMARNIACDISKAKVELGYNPEISLEEGMKRSIEWCRARGIEI